nr:hypothetical protein [Bacteroidota bacterium]
MNQDILTMKIEEAAIFDTSDLEGFSRLNIFTIEELLGATRGLENISAFENFNNFPDKFNSLAQMIPEDVLETFRSYTPKYPMGYIIDNPNQTTEDDEIK